MWQAIVEGAHLRAARTGRVGSFAGILLAGFSQSWKSLHLFHDFEHPSKPLLILVSK
jgi:hypothetical protein